MTTTTSATIPSQPTPERRCPQCGGHLTVLTNKRRTELTVACDRCEHAELYKVR